ncbi:DNA topoisomerase IB [Nocardioides terrisoli]|uniref:DNA topoisomerase IB n=1 Tax=Nocardioides terrisoli TaxID=3388267 RepID=UPI00287B8AD9|nr:DNA topoisomerase IB [Nocardioides marmorisolisilvae]
MPRLRRVSPDSPGWTRRRAGAGFVYLDEDGERLGADAVRRIKELVIPPAWEEVWICPLPHGHIQVVGTDDAGRRQYLYHPAWRARRDRMKFDRVKDAAPSLPRVRRALDRHLALEGMPRERAGAAAVRLLDLGCFRIGSDVYADANGSFGLTTLQRQHVRRRGEEMVFLFPGKSGKEHEVVIDDGRVLPVLEEMRRRRGGSDRLLAYRHGRRWLDLDASAVNEYLAELLDSDLTAKDFRTWHATVLAAVALAESDETGVSKASRKRAVRAAVVEVADYLGNTPAVARGSYIDPQVLERYDDGLVLDPARWARCRSPESRQHQRELGVLDLLGDDPAGSDRVRRR